MGNGLGAETLLYTGAGLPEGLAVGLKKGSPKPVRQERLQRSKSGCAWGEYRLIRVIIQTVIEGAIKRFTASGHAGERIADRDYFQHYGLTSHPPGRGFFALCPGHSSCRRLRFSVSEYLLPDKFYCGLSPTTFNVLLKYIF
jgi:hypothetical protein